MHVFLFLFSITTFEEELTSRVGSAPEHDRSVNGDVVATENFVELQREAI